MCCIQFQSDLNTCPLHTLKYHTLTPPSCYEVFTFPITNDLLVQKATFYFFTQEKYQTFYLLNTYLILIKVSQSS